MHRYTNTPNSALCNVTITKIVPPCLIMQSGEAGEINYNNPRIAYVQKISKDSFLPIFPCRQKTTTCTISPARLDEY